MNKSFSKVMTTAVLTAVTISCLGCGGYVNEYKSKVREKSEEALLKISEEAKAELKEKGEELKSEIKEKGNELAEDALEKKSSELVDKETGNGILTGTQDINLHDVDGKDQNYSFNYGDEEFTVLYRTDNWKILDSYKITNSDDMIIICRALIEIHPVHGIDLKGFRTPEDMAYEWLQHNMAYELLPEDNVFRKKAKDVDLNPEDQGKSMTEIYESRTGKKFSVSDFLK